MWDGTTCTLRFCTLCRSITALDYDGKLIYLKKNDSNYEGTLLLVAPFSSALSPSPV